MNLDQIEAAFHRAGVYNYFDFKNQNVHYVSTNAEAPLTDEEKEGYVTFQKSQGFPYPIVFDN